MPKRKQRIYTERPPSLSLFLPPPSIPQTKHPNKPRISELTPVGKNEREKRTCTDGRASSKPNNINP